MKSLRAVSYLDLFTTEHLEKYFEKQRHNLIITSKPFSEITPSGVELAPSDAFKVLIVEGSILRWVYIANSFTNGRQFGTYAVVLLDNGQPITTIEALNCWVYMQSLRLPLSTPLNNLLKKLSMTSNNE